MMGEPPAISTSPLRSRVEVKLLLFASMDPVGVQTFGPAPYPAVPTPCGLCGALSATATLAVRGPVAAGANWTDTLKLAPGMTGALVQPVDPRKSLGCGPDTSMPLTVSAALP